MSRIRILAALAAVAFAAILPAIPASAAAFTQQCDQSGGCMNLWGGGFAVKSYYGTTSNNWITVQWINNTTFELRDNVAGGCIGALNAARHIYVLMARQ